MINSRDSDCCLSEESLRKLAREKIKQDADLLSRLWQKPTKPTRYEKILANMTIEQMAGLRTEYSTGDGDYWYENDAGKWHELSSAIEAEIDWLNGEDDTPEEEDE